MAEATKSKTKVTKINLVLSEEEAKALKSLLYAVGGSTINTARKYTDNISLALNEIGITYGNTYKTEGSIYFLE